MTDTNDPIEPAEPTTPKVPEKLSYVSTTVLAVGVVFSVIILAGSLWVWYALGKEIRDQVTWPQAATLLFFVMVMIAMMLAIGYSHLWAANGEVVIRNGPVMRRIKVENIAGLRLRRGDAWAYVLEKDPEADGGIRKRATLAIQSMEGEKAQRKVRELRQWLVANGASSEGVRKDLD